MFLYSFLYICNRNEVMNRPPECLAHEDTSYELPLMRVCYV